MINRVYAKSTNPVKLCAELAAVALPQHPLAGARFYGVSGSDADTAVHVYDDLTAPEEVLVDLVVANHVKTPSPPVETEIVCFSKNGTKWCLTVDDNGILTTTKVS